MHCEPVFRHDQQHSVCCDEAEQPKNAAHGKKTHHQVTFSGTFCLFPPSSHHFNIGSYCSWLDLLFVLRLISEPILMIHVHIVEDPFGDAAG